MMKEFYTAPQAQRVCFEAIERLAGDEEITFGFDTLLEAGNQGKPPIENAGDSDFGIDLF